MSLQASCGRKTVQDLRVRAFGLTAATDIAPTAYMRALYLVALEIRPIFRRNKSFLIAGRQMIRP
jgi:hypothetical protein